MGKKGMRNKLLVEKKNIDGEEQRKAFERIGIRQIIDLSLGKSIPR